MVKCGNGIWSGEELGLMWEIPMVEVFYDTIQQTGLKGTLNDQWVWKGKKNLEYSVQDAYVRVRVMGEALGEDEEVFFYLWSVKAVPASQICSWRVILNRLTTRDKLIKLGIQVKNALCVICNYREENLENV